MKKSFLMVAACAALVFGVTSCNPDKTGEEYLIDGKKGWLLTSAISTPAYETTEGDKVSNLLTGFLMDCERDDLMHFNENGSQVINPGKDKRTTDPADDNFECKEMGEKSLGNWALANDEKSFTSFFLPYFDSNLGQKGAVEVVAIEEKTLTINVKIVDDVNNVTFTLIYAKQ